MANKSLKAHLEKKYKNTGLSLPDCLPLTFTQTRLRRKKKSLLCMRYRPSAMGFESQLKSGGEESVPNCIHSQWRAWDSAAVCEQGRGGGSGWMRLHKTCQGQGWKGTLLHTNCVGKHMENSSKNQENLVETVRSSYKQGILGVLLPCHCRKVRDDNIIIWL